MDNMCKCYRQAVSKMNHIQLEKGEDFALVFDGKLSCL